LIASTKVKYSPRLGVECFASGRAHTRLLVERSQSLQHFQELLDRHALNDVGTMHIPRNLHQYGITERLIGIGLQTLEQLFHGHLVDFSLHKDLIQSLSR
jgi:hypothetical protein